MSGRGEIWGDRQDRGLGTHAVPSTTHVDPRIGAEQATVQNSTVRFRFDNDHVCRLGRRAKATVRFWTAKGGSCSVLSARAQQRRTWMNPTISDSPPPPSPQVLETCPRCTAASGTLNLLTSMTRYYVCGRCACRWHTSRFEANASRDRALRSFP
jgi:hypothetical protein